MHALMWLAEKQKMLINIKIFKETNDVHLVKQSLKLDFKHQLAFKGSQMAIEIVWLF
jgi:hypothetical protein